MPGVEQLVLDLVGDRRDVPFAAARHEKEDVDERQGLRHVEGDEVFPALGVRRGGGDVEHLMRLRAHRHQNTPVTNARISTPTRASARTPAVMASVIMSLLPF